MTRGFKIFLFLLLGFLSFWAYQYRNSDLRLMLKGLHQLGLQMPTTRPAGKSHPVSEVIDPDENTISIRFTSKAPIEAEPESWHSGASQKAVVEEQDQPQNSEIETVAIDQLPLAGLGPEPTPQLLEGDGSAGEVRRETRLDITEGAGAPPHQADAQEDVHEDADEEDDEGNDEGTIEIEYVVQEDDNLWSVARDYLGRGSDYTRIVEWNSLPDEDIVHPGRKLKLRVPITPATRSLRRIAEGPRRGRGR